jgi:hypothetical protein
MRKEEIHMNVYFRKIMMVAILLGWISFGYEVFAEGIFDPAVSLPFELCNIMQMTIFYAFWKNKENLVHMIAFPLVLGPVIALSHPVGLYDLGGYFSFYFVYYHLTLIVTGLYALYLKKGRTNWEQVLSSGAFMFSCSIVATIVNIITKGNYMFIGQPMFGMTHVSFYLVLFVVAWTGLSLFHLLLNAACSFVDTLAEKNDSKKIKMPVQQ